LRWPYCRCERGPLSRLHSSGPFAAEDGCGLGVFCTTTLDVRIVLRRLAAIEAAVVADYADLTMAQLR
jgi:hypothetical protein